MNDYMEDIIKEERENDLNKEVCDAELDDFISDQYENLINDFIEYYYDEWRDFCKEKYEESK